MAYGVPEFPNYLDGDRKDLREFIDLYKELVGKYSETLAKIDAVNKRLDDYIASQDEQLATWRQEQLTTLTEWKADMEAEFATWKQTTMTEVTSAVTDITSELTVRQSKLEDDFDGLGEAFDDLDAEFTTYTNFVVNAVDSFREEFQQGDNEIRGELVVAMANLDKGLSDKLEAMEVEIYATIDQLECMSNAEAVLWLWNNAVTGCALNAYCWYMLSGVSCEDWNRTKITALDWHIRSQDIFKDCMIISPVTGDIMSLENVLSQIANIMKPCPITAEQYDALKLKAGDYDSKLITAYNYDQKGRRVLNG